MFAFFRSKWKPVAAAAALLGASSAFSGSAQASFYWDVSADAGSFAPTVLGEDISLDGCGSRLFLAAYPHYGLSMCEVVNISLFGANWFAKNLDTGAFSWLTGNLGTDENIDVLSIPENTAAGNLQTTVSTGAGTFFSSPGTYAIGLYVAGTNNHVTFTEETSWVINDSATGVVVYEDTYINNGSLGTDYASSLSEAISSNGELNNAAAWSSSFTISGPVTVPEPMQLLMLVPGLALIARRQRKKKAA